MAQTENTKLDLTSITLKIKEDFKKYVNVNRWFSYDYLHFFLIIGGRGIGKTTGLNIHNVKDFIRNGDEFVYCRRYITELKKAKSMLPALVNNCKCVGLGHGLLQWEVNKTRIGYGVALTAQQTLKSGVDFSRVHTLVYDECILPNGGSYRYLANEIEMLFELISTIFRDRTDYNIFLIGNNADMFNPYFAYFNIPRFERNYIDKERGIYCELCQNSAELAEAEKKTPLYKLTQGTSYGEYHYNNKVLTSVEGKIGLKPLNAKLECRVVYNNVTMNVYRANFHDMFVELRDKVIKDRDAYVIMENGKPNYLYIDLLRKSDMYKIIQICYYNNYVTYDSERTAAVFSMFMEEI